MVGNGWSMKNKNRFVYRGYIHTTKKNPILMRLSMEL